MIKRFLLPYWAGSPQNFVDAMCRCALQALQDIHERIRPALRIPERRKYQVNMVGHHDSNVEADSPPVFTETMFQNQVAGHGGKRLMRQRTEGDEQVAVGLLQMREPATVSVFSKNRA